MSLRLPTMTLRRRMIAFIVFVAGHVVMLTPPLFMLGVGMLFTVPATICLIFGPWPERPFT